MAIVHYKLEIVPLGSFGLKLHEHVPSESLRAGLDPWPGTIQPLPEVVERLRKLLPVNTSWGEVEEFESSNEWGSDLRIWNEGLRVENIEFRHSPLSDPWALMRKFLEIVQTGNYVLVEGISGLLLRADETEIASRIISSRAWKISGPPSDFPEIYSRKPNYAINPTPE